ncbi:MAG: PIG-L family deacetylase [Clostridiaceae bacterium]|nr:PIG-L family deacetylase [Clostridiaceae bacterium]
MTKTDVYMPKNANKGAVKYLVVVAHPDDGEILAAGPVTESANGKTVLALAVLTDGAGSARSGAFAAYTDDEMKAVRVKEQRAAAEEGRFESLYMLRVPSGELKAGSAEAVRAIADIIAEKQPEILITHNPFDRHPTHLAAGRTVMEALRSLPAGKRPKTVWGGEVWRSLDWLPVKYRLALPADTTDGAADRVLLCHKSQIDGGKRYDAAAKGRRLQNATFCESHSTDFAHEVAYFTDLSRVASGEITLAEFVEEVLKAFNDEILSGIKRK